MGSWFFISQKACWVCSVLTLSAFLQLYGQCCPALSYSNSFQLFWPSSISQTWVILIVLHKKICSVPDNSQRFFLLLLISSVADVSDEVKNVIQEWPLSAFKHRNREKQNKTKGLRLVIKFTVMSIRNSEGHCFTHVFLLCKTRHHFLKPVWAVSMSYLGWSSPLFWYLANGVPPKHCSLCNSK